MIMISYIFLVNRYHTLFHSGHTIHDSAVASFSHQATSLYTEEFVKVPHPLFRKIIDETMKEVLDKRCGKGSVPTTIITKKKEQEDKQKKQ